MAELQFLNLPAIDAQIAQAKQAEMQNAMAPFLMQKAQMDAEKGAMEIERYKADLARDAEGRNKIAELQRARTQGAQPVAQGANSTPSGIATPGAAQAPASQGGRAATHDWLRQQADVWAGLGDTARSEKLYSEAEKWRPKVKDWKQINDNGKVMYAPYFEDGSSGQPVPYEVAEKLVLRNTGQTTDAINPFTGAVVSSVKNTQSPDSVASTASAAASRAQAERHFQSNFNAPQYMETSQGLVALPKKLPAGQTPVGMPVMGADGQPIGPKLKDIPANANTSITTNLQNLNRAQTALSLVTGKDVGSVKADPARSDPNATGWHGYLPNTILNYVDAKGVDARAAIADLGSLVIHDRSGAAVTAAEFPRLAPFIPTPTDDAATVQKKLNRFIDVYQQETNALADTYSREQGYKPNPNLEKAKRTPATTPQGRVEADSMPSPAQYSGATVTDTSTGIKYRSDGKNWVRVQ